MQLGTFNKQPVEVLDYDINYSDWLTAGDNVDSFVVAIAPAGQLAVNSQFVNDPYIKIWLAGGVDGVTYKLTVTMTTADGRVKQDEFKVKVKDI